MRDLSQGIEGGDGMPVLDPGKIAPQQPGALFDVALVHAFLQPVGPDCGANVHAGKSSETLSSLRECLNSNQSWNFVQAQFFHTAHRPTACNCQILSKDSIAYAHSVGNGR